MQFLSFFFILSSYGNPFNSYITTPSTSNVQKYCFSYVSCRWAKRRNMNLFLTLYIVHASNEFNSRIIKSPPSLSRSLNPSAGVKSELFHTTTNHQGKGRTREGAGRDSYYACNPFARGTTSVNGLQRQRLRDHSHRNRVPTLLDKGKIVLQATQRTL